ncbi:ATP-binding protein [Caldanaerobius polysaccharolyticus]|uniref:ATP-binding protein n=1 Tax=Caldanaerobius polysaccharolyticus TaxID=44256 RepID=UPI000478A829|nr:ATP-binding protein [Caldanaerobius polysaccharolyticus]
MSETVLTPPKKLHPKIKLASEMTLYVKALIYGEPGAGKTYLACTAPNPLVLLTEYDVSKATMLRVQKDLNKEIAVWPVAAWSDLEEAFEFLQSGEHDFQTVVLDSLTDLNRRLTRSIVETAVERRPSHDPDVPEQGDWFRVSEKLRHMVRMFRDLPMHVVMTCLVQDVRQEMLKVPLVQPRSLALELPGLFNLVGCLKAVETDDGHVRKLLVEATDTYVAKNPGGVLPPVIESPNFTKIFEEVCGNAKTVA